jgi:dihydroorotase
MLEALIEAKRVTMPVISHCEDLNLSKGGTIQDGLLAARLGVKGIPCCAEEIMVARDICLAEATETRLHLAHISTAGSLRFIREAKSRGIQVTAEAAPHHFTLTTETILEKGPLAKMNPPLRSSFHCEAVRRGLKDGTLDVVASDHAPHSPQEKDMPLSEAPFGVIGLETSLPLLLALVHNEEISLARAVELLTSGPAKVIGLGCGVLRPGDTADITVVDLEHEFVVDVSKFKSKAKNSPFHGRCLKGCAVMTMVGGKIAYEQVDCIKPRTSFFSGKGNNR